MIKIIQINEIIDNCKKYDIQIIIESYTDFLNNIYEKLDKHYKIISICDQYK